MNYFGFKWRAYALVAFLLLLSISGCKKDDDNPLDPNNNNNTGMSGSITLNGDGFSNKVYNFTIAGAEYSVTDSKTVVALDASGTDTVRVGIFFNSNATGTFNFSETDDDIINGLLVTIGTQKIYYSHNTGSITVTQYGAVGAAVSGTFQGSVQEVYENGIVTVSGSFKAFRGPDVN